MKWPWARAACITVWSSSACTGWPLMKNSTMRDPEVEPAAQARAFVLDVVLELVAVLGEDAGGGIARRIAHAADGGAVVGLADADQLLDVAGAAVAVDDAVNDAVHPAHAFAAGRALAAGFVVIEAQQHLQQPDHAGAFADDHHAARADAGTC